MSDDPPRHPSTLRFEAITFEQELEAWMRRSSGYLGFTDEQISVVVQHAAAIARKRGMTR